MLSVFAAQGQRIKKYATNLLSNRACFDPAILAVSTLLVLGSGKWRCCCSKSYNEVMWEGWSLCSVWLYQLPQQSSTSIHSQNLLFKSELGNLVIRNPNPGFLTSVSTIWNSHNLFWNNCIWTPKLRLDLLVRHSLPCNSYLIISSKQYKTNICVGICFIVK
jgi:hypothetical protein